MKIILKQAMVGGAVALSGVVGLVATPLNAQAINGADGAVHYANTRGWSVYEVADGRGIYGCRAVRGSGYSDQIMIEYNAFDSAWNLYVQARRPGGGGPGILGAGAYYDRTYVDRQVSFGLEGEDGASDTHAKMNIEENEFGMFKSGKTLRLDINGEQSRTWSLKGTAAAIGKVAECAQSWGPVLYTNVAPVLKPAPAAPAPAPTAAPAQSAASSVVDGMSIGYVAFRGVNLHRTNGLNWVEEDVNGAVVATYQEYDRNVDGVFLKDVNEDLQLWISLRHGDISATRGFNHDAWQPTYQIDCYAREAGRSC